MNIEQLKSFYQEKIQDNKTLLNDVRRRIHFVGTLRLVVVLAAACLVYVFWSTTAIVLAAVALASILLLLLVRRHNMLYGKRDYYRTSVRVAQEELAAIDYDFSAFDGAPERVNASHGFSLDVDLFGEKSLFQSLNRTVTPDGKNTLADWFEKPLSDKASIQERQQAVDELKAQYGQRLAFRVNGLISQEDGLRADDLKAFSEEPVFILPQKWLWKSISWLYPLFWVATIVLTASHIWPSSVIVLGIIALCALSECRTKKIDRLQESLGKKMKTLASYAELIRLIEEHEPQSAALNEIKSGLTHDGRTISLLIKDLSGYLSNLDQRSGGVGRVILNTLLLWDIRYVLKIEEWKENHGKYLSQWIGRIGEYDALCSLGTFAFNHDAYVYPEVDDRYFCLQAQALGHPLMHRDVCVRNDIDIEKHPYFLIITGANMAGKSTYLRTVAVNYLLASVGAPVCAASFRFYPACLVTSLRTSDSLNDNESYFFAELKRLKMIIDKLKNGQRLFIILDEILKGTNSVDKQKGSIALMKQLIAMDGCGIIATHDLALGGLIDEFPGNISNYRFEADIRDNELSFSYTLQTGVAENMNACFLMNKMGITVG